MPDSLFSIKVDGSWVTFPHLRVLSCEQTFQVLDKDSYRALAGNMNRNIIGTYYNYKLKLKPEKTEDGMRDYSKLWYIVSAPVDSYEIKVPFDCSNPGTVHTTITFNAYITSGARDMTKYNVNGVDYWGEGEFNFIAMDKAR